jgi:hypothetical protein
MKKGLFIGLIVILIIGVFYHYYLENIKATSITGLSTIEEELDIELDTIITEVTVEKLKPEENIFEIDVNDTSEFVIAGLKIGSTRELVKEIYGEPEYVEKISDLDDAYIWFYEGLELSFYGNYLNPITVKSTKYPTTKGIKVGDPRSDVLEKYNSARQF